VLDDLHSKLLGLAKECYSMKLELLTNATVVDDAIQFVSDRSSNPRVGKDMSQMEDNDKREVTTNKVFE
jgi:hypothetical protein